MAKKEEAKDVVPQQTRAVATVTDEDVGAGFEGMSQDELAVPFLIILQKNSPQVEEGNAKYVAGAKAGSILNTVTQELYDGKEGITFVPCHREQRFIEWVPRDEGGGLVAVHEPQSQVVIEAKRAAKSRYGKMTLDNGNELAETFSVYGMLVHAEGVDPVIIAFGSTQIKHYKRWMTRAMSITARKESGERVVAPLFSHQYQLRTKTESNKKGSWFGWDIGFAGGSAATANIPQGTDLYEIAKGFRSAVTSGTVKAQGLEHTEETDDVADDGASPEAAGKF